MSSFEMLEPMTRDRPLKSIGLLLVENFCLIAFAAVTEPCAWPTNWQDEHFTAGRP